MDELFSEQGRRSFFSTHSREEWRVVRKGTAPAFSQDNMRKLFPRMMQARPAARGGRAGAGAGGGVRAAASRRERSHVS